MTQIIMKKFIVLFFAAFAMMSCEDIQDNTPALQGTLDQSFFKAIDARAARNIDGSFLIQGTNVDETLTMRISGRQLGTYNVGAQTLNYAFFEDAGGNLYATNPFGIGKIELTNYDDEAKTLSGSFSFQMVLAGIDTLTVSSGLFFEVPFGLGPIEDPADGEIGNAGDFFAEINGQPFTPINVGAVDQGNRIKIIGDTSPVRIEILVPDGVQPGNYSLASGQFDATYRDGTVYETVVSGNIQVTGHDFAAKTLQATFNFETETTSITSGTFDVAY